MKDFDDVPADYGTYSDSWTIKAIILEKRQNLSEAYDRYLEVTVLRKKSEYPPGWIKWMQALNSLYLEIRSKIRGKQRYALKYDKTIEVMDNVLMKGGELNQEQAIACTLELIDFCEEIGITDILFERQDKNRAVLGKW